MFVMVLCGAMMIGSAIWGQIANLTGLPSAQFVAGAGALLAVPVTWGWKLEGGTDLDLSPSTAWPEPITVNEIEPERGPVLVTLEYDIDPKKRRPFLKALRKLGRERRRDGAYQWAVFEDPANASRFIENFLTDSWLEHLRQHERVTKADSALQKAVDRFQTKSSPKVTHLIAVDDSD
jgi:Transmembrane secretion effector